MEIQRKSCCHHPHPFLPSSLPISGTLGDRQKKDAITPAIPKNTALSLFSSLSAMKSQLLTGGVKESTHFNPLVSQIVVGRYCQFGFHLMNFDSHSSQRLNCFRTDL